MIFTGWVMPALLIRMSTRPSPATTAAAARLAVRLAGDVALDANVAGTDVGGGLFGRFSAQVEDGDPCTVLGEEPRGGLADAACGGSPGDDCNFVVQQHGVLQRV